MSNKFDGDVRPLSNDPRYMGAPFSGPLDDALLEASMAPEFGLPEQPGRPAHISRDRWNLLEHLGLSRFYTAQLIAARLLIEEAAMRADESAVQVGPDSFESWMITSPYSLEAAKTRWPECFQPEGDPNRGSSREQWAL